jgi:small subunit ribosomal protein S18
MFKKENSRHGRNKPGIRQRSKVPCFFCKGKVEPDYKNIQQLEKFTTDRGKIIARAWSGLCQKHQRRLSRAIKRARFLALLPFISQV